MVSNKRPKASKNGTKPQPQASSPSPPPPESSPVPTEDAAPPSYPPRVTAFLQQVSWTPANPNSPSFPGQVLKHALAGDPRAMAIYGLFLQTGSGGVLRDEKLALAWLTSAASALLVDDSEKSNGIGTVPIGTSLKNPKSTNIASTLSPSKNVSSKTASTKSVDNTTPQIPSSPRPDIPAPTSAIASHEMAPIVQVLGDAYRRGLGCSPDLNTAFRLLQRAAQLGHSDGLVGLANMYERGDGVVRDENIAFGLFKKAADRGSVYAMFKVFENNSYELRHHVDYVQAKHWYRQAAARGHFPSSVRLAILSMDPACESIDMLAAAAESLKTPRSFHDYAAGLSTSHHGAVPNIKEARKWYRRSANAGYVRAQWLLGSAYAEAAKVNPKEFRKAFYWYHAAAVQGFQPAQWAVGNMYRLGQGVEKDLVIADKWHRAASRSGMERCNVDAFDSAIVTVHSLTESVAPVWNTAEGTRPPGVFDNLGVPFLPIVTPVVLPEDSFSGPLAPGVVFANQGESPTHNVKVEAGSSAHNKIRRGWGYHRS
ncbi:hypothetical protein BC829DRAFT_418735 [Chytridium lagenaria]|nr:hypothetical protein BC829DRAFT_418735 [Chytridium lagenaria]